MRIALLIITALVLSGCGSMLPPRVQKGGAAQTVIPATQATVQHSAGNAQDASGEVLTTLPPVQPVTISLSQPDNPDGKSTVDYEEKTITTAPDGTKVESTKKTRTVVGGSQDFASIVKEYANAAEWRKWFLALGLAVAAWVALRRGWPFVAGALALGAYLTIASTWWAGVAALGVCGLVYLVYQIKPVV